jgi:hypothetical protein
MRYCRNGGTQFGGAPAFGDQEAKEHAQGRRALLGGCPPRLPARLEDKPPQALRIEYARIFVDACQQISKRALVVIKGCIGGSALLAHPLTECGEKNGIMGLRFRSAGHAEALPAKEPREQARTAQQICAMRVAVPGTSTPSQVSVKTLNDPLVHRPVANAFLTRPIDKVFRCAEVPARSDPRVARAEQLLSKPLNLRSARTVAKGSNA